MFTDELDELEVAILLKRLEILKAQGITGRSVFSLGDDFFALLEDKWICDGLLTTIHGFQEMYDKGRDEAVGETLNSPEADTGAESEPFKPAVPLKKKRGRKSKKELAELEIPKVES